MITIILAGLVGTIISVVIGTFWYSGATPMGRWHMQYLGFDKLSEEEKQKMIAEAKPKMWKTYLAQMILSFLTSLFIAFVHYYTVQSGGPANAVFYYVVMIWIAFTVPLIGQGMLWGSSGGTLALKRFFSDSFCNLITFLVIALACVLIL
jgi:hypothetical protein